MAALYGRLQGNRGETTRTGSEKSGIESKLETWTGSIRTVLQADGSPNQPIAAGNLKEATNVGNE